MRPDNFSDSEMECTIVCNRDEIANWDALPVDIRRETGQIQYHFNAVTFERYTQLGGCHAKLDARVKELAE